MKRGKSKGFGTPSPPNGKPCPWAPARNGQAIVGKPWEGSIERKPWDYSCEAVIPVLDTPDTLAIVIELLRLQTARPYIIIIDTGSSPESFEAISAMRAADVEVHSLRFNGVRHPSDFPAIAMDLAMSMCRTEFMFCTHADVFLRRRDVVEEMLALCSKKEPVVGYQITPRAHKDWEEMVSHTCTMLHMPTMDAIGAGWSLRRLCNKREVEHIPNILGNNWPDTEILLNYILWENNLKAKLIGSEANHARTLDDRIDHCRTLTAGRLYSPQYAAECQLWVDAAVTEASDRINQWRLPQ